MSKFTNKWMRQAVVVLGVTIIAFAIGYLSGHWRFGGYATLDSIYICDDERSVELTPRVARSSIIQICGAVSGNVNWGAGMYVRHNNEVVVSRSIQLSPGAFSFSVPTQSTWPTGTYKIDFVRAQKPVAELAFELITD